jgi:hypothetical protein
MATTSSKLKIKLQAYDENSGTWGDPELNTALKGLEEGIAGYEAVEIAGSDVTLDVTNYTIDVADHYRNMVLKLTPGASVAARNVIVPAVEKVYLIHNTTGYTQTIKVSGGTTNAEVETGQVRFVYCDGTASCYAQSTSAVADTGAFELISSNTIGGSVASTDISIAGSYKAHKIIFENITFASAATGGVMLRLSADNVTYASTGYVNQATHARASTITDDASETDGLYIYKGPSSSPTQYFNAEVTLFGAANSAARTGCVAHSLGYNGSAFPICFVKSFYDTARTDTHIRFLADGVNHTGGKIYVYGMT